MSTPNPTSSRSFVRPGEILEQSGLARSKNQVEPNLSATRDEGRNKYELGSYGYGKNHVKLLYVHREGAYHEIREYEVDTHLRLTSQKDYLEGDNEDIIATDSQKNTVYLLAKKHGVQTPEEFAILVCSHFLYTYRHVAEVNVNVEEYPWQRHTVDGEPHNHAFVFTPTTTRYCQVTQLRNGELKNAVADITFLLSTPF